MKQSLIQALQSRLTEGKLLFNQPLKEYTSFRIGGAASVLLLPKTAAGLKDCCRILNEKERSVLQWNCGHYTIFWPSPEKET